MEEEARTRRPARATLLVAVIALLGFGVGTAAGKAPRWWFDWAYERRFIVSHATLLDGSSASSQESHYVKRVDWGPGPDALPDEALLHPRRYLFGDAADELPAD